MLNKTLIYCFLFTLHLACFSQTKNNESYTLCEGKINIFKAKEFDVQLKNETNSSGIFKNYPALNKITSSNQIWATFIAPEEGMILLDIQSEQTFLKLVVFDAHGENICSDLANGNAEIIRLILPDSSKHIGLNKQVTRSFMYPIKLKAGQPIHFAIIAPPESTEMLRINMNFESSNPVKSISETKVMDFSEDDFKPKIKLEIRDEETGNPIIASVVLKDLKDHSGMYRASDLVFDVESNDRFAVICEKEGYFVLDSSEITIQGNQQNQIVLKMSQVKSGKSIQIEHLEFVPGTSKITDRSIPKLKRLRDFLALNSKLNIEVQGHVYDSGGQSLAGQKMSEARAKRIVNYLIDNGIDRSRLSYVGFGCTKPIYEFPITPSQVQANRRVEIVVR